MWGSCDLLKAIDPKSEYCRELQPRLYFPDTHLLLMADGLPQGKDEFLRIVDSFVDVMNADVLSSAVLIVPCRPPLPAAYYYKVF